MTAKIALLFEYGTVSGGENSLLTLLPLLHTKGITFCAITPDETGPLAEKIKALNVEWIPLANRDTTLAGRRESLARLLRPMQSSVTLFHANSLSMGRLAGPVTAELGIRSVAHLRDIIRLSRAAVDDLRRHHALFAVSDAVRRFHLEQGVDSERCHVLYNGVDLVQFQPTEPTFFLHRELHLPTNAKLLGTIGQIGLRKGQKRLLETIKPLFIARNDFHVVILGERWSGKAESIQYEAELRQLAASRPFCGRVHFLGFRHDIDKILRELTVLVHPAFQEPLGRVLLEAAASGCCVVASNVGGTAEIFPPETNTASLFSWEHPESLSPMLERLLDDENLRYDFGRRARKRVEERFSAEFAAENLSHHYSFVVRPEN